MILFESFNFPEFLLVIVFMIFKDFKDIQLGIYHYGIGQLGIYTNEKVTHH